MNPKFTSSIILFVLTLSGLPSGLRAATIVNLGTATVDGTPVSNTGYVDALGENVVGGFVNEVFFRRTLNSDNFGSGSGGFRDLYRVQDNSTAANPENGYNRNVMPDVSIPGGFNPILTVGDLSTSSEGDAYVFAFDTHESTGGNSRWISLDDIQIRVGGPTDPGVLPTGPADLGLLGTSVYKFNKAGEQNFLFIDSSLFSGSGQMDVFVFVPKALFNGFAANSQVYVYTSWGQYGYMGSGRSGGLESSATPEQVASAKEAFSSTVPFAIPEPRSASGFMMLFLLGLVLRREASRK